MVRSNTLGPSASCMRPRRLFRGALLVFHVRHFAVWCRPTIWGYTMTKYLHTMIRVSSLEDSIAFFEVLGLREIRRRPDEKGRYTNVFLAAPGDEAAAVELTYNWDPEPYTGGRNFGHLAYAVDNIYDTCNAFIAHGVTINRPPRDGRMAFVRTPDGISIELLQAGAALPPAEPWTTMANTGSW